MMGWVADPFGRKLADDGKRSDALDVVVIGGASCKHKGESQGST